MVISLDDTFSHRKLILNEPYGLLSLVDKSRRSGIYLKHSVIAIATNNISSEVLYSRSSRTSFAGEKYPCRPARTIQTQRNVGNG